MLFLTLILAVIVGVLHGDADTSNHLWQAFLFFAGAITGLLGGKAASSAGDK